MSKKLCAALLVSVALAFPGTASAETIFGALTRAYQNNSELNSARAGVRVTDENVPIAKSGYRPTIAATGSLNYQNSSGTDLRTGSFGVQINQTLFDGFQTKNNVLSAKSRVFASRESLRNTEQNILYNAAAAYLDVIRDRQIAVLRERNLEFLEEQVRAARSRFEVGEGSGDPKDAPSSSGRQAEQVHSATEQCARLGGGRDDRVQDAVRDFSVRCEAALLLNRARRFDPALDLATGGPRSRLLELTPRHGRDLDVQIDPIQERA